MERQKLVVTTVVDIRVNIESVGNRVVNRVVNIGSKSGSDYARYRVYDQLVVHTISSESVCVLKNCIAPEIRMCP